MEASQATARSPFVVHFVPISSAAVLSCAPPRNELRQHGFRHLDQAHHVLLGLIAGKAANPKPFSLTKVSGSRGTIFFFGSTPSSERNAGISSSFSAPTFEIERPKEGVGRLAGSGVVTHRDDVRVCDGEECLARSRALGESLEGREPD